MTDHLRKIVDAVLTLQCALMNAGLENGMRIVVVDDLDQLKLIIGSSLDLCMVDPNGRKETVIAGIHFVGRQ